MRYKNGYGLDGDGYGVDDVGDRREFVGWSICMVMVLSMILYCDPSA